MNVTSRFALGFFGSLALATAPTGAESTQEVMLDNRMSYSLTLYVDGKFGCGPALAGLSCVAQVPVGPQLWEAKSGEKVIASKNATVTAGSSRVFLVCMIDPDTQRCRGMM